MLVGLIRHLCQFGGGACISIKEKRSLSQLTAGVVVITMNVSGRCGLTSRSA